MAKLNSRNVARVSRSMVKSQILPRLSFVSELRNMAWLHSRKQIFAARKKPVMLNVHPV